MMYRVKYGAESWLVEAESEEDAIEEIAAGLAQYEDRFAHPRDETALDELSAEEVTP